jgi:hypothetical protein
VSPKLEQLFADINLAEIKKNELKGFYCVENIACTDR